MGKKRKREDETSTVNDPKSPMEEVINEAANDDFEGFNDESENGGVSFLSDEDGSESAADSESSGESSDILPQQEQATSVIEKG